MASPRPNQESSTVGNPFLETAINNEPELDASLTANTDSQATAQNAVNADTTGSDGRLVPEASSTIPTDNTSVQPSVSNVHRVCSSGSSSLCRICQLNREESALSLETSRCSCRGSLAKVHRRCLERWVHYRGSNQCEICGSRFVAVANPSRRNNTGVEPEISPPDNFYFQTLETIRLQLMQVQPINRRKRTALAAFLVFLVLVTVVTAVLTVGADQDFQKTNNNPWATDADLRKTHIVFSICLSFLFFCITLTIGLTLMWGAIELYLHVRRRQIFRSAAERLVNNAANS